jgi:hypothetical protein
LTAYADVMEVACNKIQKIKGLDFVVQILLKPFAYTICFHASAAFTPGKLPPAPIGQRLGEHQSHSACRVEYKKLALPEIESKPSSPKPVTDSFTYSNERRNLLKKCVYYIELR